MNNKNEFVTDVFMKLSDLNWRVLMQICIITLSACPVLQATITGGENGMRWKINTFIFGHKLQLILSLSFFSTFSLARPKIEKRAWSHLHMCCVGLK